MIVCQCNLLSTAEIEAAVERLLAEDPWRLIVPSTVYHAMGRRGRCCGCFPDVVALIAEVTARMQPSRAAAGGRAPAADRAGLTAPRPLPKSGVDTRSRRARQV
ncbi:(2Fe-2S)-binding protein [Hoeflea olei]|uniref:(2Fe-2S)-binding protein n=1 Tax=Hoeflea olei TaxID=1480615 RepID=A0A1C1YYT6_9HYPH|nr:hypothetical protein AWJ14_05675 [Hoeflea olei]